MVDLRFSRGRGGSGGRGIGGRRGGAWVFAGGRLMGVMVVGGTDGFGFGCGFWSSGQCVSWWWKLDALRLSGWGNVRLALLSSFNEDLECCLLGDSGRTAHFISVEARKVSEDEDKKTPSVDRSI